MTLKAKFTLNDGTVYTYIGNTDTTLPTTQYTWTGTGG